MPSDAWKRWTVAVPGGAVAVIMGGVWVVMRLNSGEASRLAFVGWLGILLLAVTVAGVVWGAICGQGIREPGRHGSEYRPVALLLLAWGILVLVCAGSIGAVGVGGGFLGWGETLRILLLFASWSALWTLVAFWSRRWGAGVSVGLSLAVAMLLMAGPVTLVPLARGAAWGGSVFSRERVAAAIEIGCPLLGTLDAARPGVTVNWQTMPRMYAMAEGQEVAFALPAWWMNCLAYAGATAMLALLIFLLRPKIIDTPRIPATLET